MKNSQPKTKGLHHHRYKDNPEELRFAMEWDDEMTGHLKYMLCPPEVDQRFPPVPSPRDEIVAATTIQWLGSPVGQSFLQRLGYTKKGTR